MCNYFLQNFFAKDLFPRMGGRGVSEEGARKLRKLLMQNIIFKGILVTMTEKQIGFHADITCNGGRCLWA